MSAPFPFSASSTVAKFAHHLTLSDPEEEYAPLVDAIGDAQFVLIGEASHGTHNFYRERIEITKLLIEHKGFAAIAVEADWPDAYRLNRYVRGEDSDRDAQKALDGFRRFPAWMWRNMDVLAFAEWLRGYNPHAVRPVGFYGLDLYSLYTSAAEVLRFLQKVDPHAAARARYRYSCFDQFGEDMTAYGYAAGYDLTKSCEDDAVNQLAEMRRKAHVQAMANGGLSELFSAEENVHVVRDAERYYRTMFGGRVNSWNVRDQHMADTLGRLHRHLGRDSKIVLWAHNSHLGDARATEMGRQGELNLGQLVRQSHPDRSFLIGFTTHSGEVTAASDWEEPAGRKKVGPALAGSYEALFHESVTSDFLLDLRIPEVHDALARPMLERAIGVVYRPDTERQSHYFEARLSEQFDVVIHIDRTKALIPLEKSTPWVQGEVPETFPSAV